MRDLLHSPEFAQHHRLKPKHCTRKRVMNLPRVVLFILQKTTRSIARHLHDFLDALDFADAQPPNCTAGAWTRARAKLSHGALVELHDSLLVPSAYAGSTADASLKLWRSHRLIGFDGSVVRLPKSASTIAEFGLVEALNQQGATGVAHCRGRVSLAYDLLNRLGWDVRLAAVTTSEVDLAADHLDSLKPDDLALMDRGYAGYALLASMCARGVQVVARCSTGSFAAAQELFRRDEAGVSIQVCLKRPAGCEARGTVAERASLPKQLHVRFVSVRLSTGELEVLVTTLLDEQRYPSEEFAWLYHQRWGVETFYLMLKSRLDLENWSGLTLEAVRQDLAATLLLFNLESLLTRQAQQVMDTPDTNEPPRQHPQKINRAVAYHALKSHLVDLLLGDDPPALLLDKLHSLFMASPVTQRSRRHAPRRPQVIARSYHYQRAIKKCVF